ncbi:MAG: EAL and HDOD domain-containing protein [Acidimicrobiales bacterium]
MGVSGSLSAGPASATPVLLGRTPIFDQRMQVLGYNFFSAWVPDSDPPSRPGSADSPLSGLLRSHFDVSNADAELVSDLAGTGKAWLNAFPGPMEEGAQLPRVAKSCVLKLSDPSEPSEPVDPVDPSPVSAGDTHGGAGWARKLVDSGHTVAVCAWSRWYDYIGEDAAYVVVDRDVASDNLAGCLDLLADHRRVTVVTGVDSVRDVVEWSRAGATVFQGHALSHPSGEATEALSPSRMACLQLLGRLRDPDTGPKELSRILSSDLSLAYRALHVSSLGSAGGLRRPVRSIEEAVILLGREKLYSWLTFMTLTDMSPHANEQVTIALVRARTCELFALATDPRIADEAFTAGLISGIALIVGIPLGQLVAKMSVTDDIAKAVLERAGDLGRILTDAHAWETAYSVPELSCGVDPVSAGAAYGEALAWVSQITRSVGLAAA